ncbi:MAG: DNA replication protein [Methylocystaceae bacterium]|nr:DNA replication protein [Methylocystaceae bacterium]
MPSNPQIPLAFDYRPSMSGEDFLVSDSNREAVAFLDLWPQWPSPFVIIYGEAGCGKSHLAQVFSEATKAIEIKLNVDPYISMGDHKTGVVENVDRLLADNQQALFHLYNFAKENDAHILLTSRTSPALWDIQLADLKSRIGAASVIEIGQPDDTLIEAVLVKQFADRQLHVERDVVAFMLTRMERSFDQARLLVNEIDQQSLAQKRKITIPLVRSVFQSLLMPYQ